MDLREPWGFIQGRLGHITAKIQNETMVFKVGGFLVEVNNEPVRREELIDKSFD